MNQAHGGAEVSRLIVLRAPAGLLQPADAIALEALAVSHGPNGSSPAV